MAHIRRPTAPDDLLLKRLIARETFTSIKHSIASNTTLIPGVISTEILADDAHALAITLRVRVDHGGERGQKYHFYQVKVSEMKP